MAIVPVWCPVAHTTVTRITDLDDRTTRVICPEYQHPAGTCRLKTAALEGGPLSQLIDRVSEDTLGRGSTRCDLM